LCLLGQGSLTLLDGQIERSLEPVEGIGDVAQGGQHFCPAG